MSQTMLVSLHVRNLALIEETEVFFQPGLNILTGETGAGKSVILARWRWRLRKGGSGYDPDGCGICADRADL